MDRFTKKSLKTARGFEYSYFVTPHQHPPRSTATPALLFLHGFPDHAQEWDDVIAFLDSKHQQLEGVAAGYKILAPNLLGYDGTSRPTDPKAYEYAAQVSDLTEILDAEAIGKVVVIGHDYGSAVAQWLYWVLGPDRVAGIVLLSLAWAPPSLDPDAPPLDIEVANKMTEEMFGYPQVAYWELTTAPDGAALLEGNLERAWESMHGDRREWVREILCTRGAWRAYLLGEHPLNGKVALKPYAAGRRREAFIERFARDGFAAPLQWYIATLTGVHRASELQIAPERLTAQVPVLFVGSDGDAVGRHDMIQGSIAKGLLPDLEIHVIKDCGHWIPVEKPEEFGGYLWEFLRAKFPLSGDKLKQ